MPAASRYLPIECHEALARCKHKGVGSWRAHACGGAATRHPHVCHKTSARTGCWKPGHVGRNMIPARRPFFAKIGPPRRNHISALAKLRPEFGRNLVGRHSLMDTNLPSRILTPLHPLHLFWAPKRHAAEPAHPLVQPTDEAPVRPAQQHHQVAPTGAHRAELEACVTAVQRTILWFDANPRGWPEYLR